MAAYAFGKDITYWFQPLVDNNTVTLAAAMQTQTPAIYVYTDEPSRSDASTGAGSPVQTIASWTWDASRSAWYFTIDAIDDPDPTSTVTIRTYWVAINFRLDAAEQLQTVLRSLDLERVAGHIVPLVVTEDDLKKFYPGVLVYSREDQRIDFINQAIDTVRSKLRAQGYAWASLHRPDRLKNAVALRAVAMILLSQAQGGNEKFFPLYREFKQLHEDEMDGLIMEIDSDGDGQADTEVKPSNDTLLVIR